MIKHAVRNWSLAVIAAAVVGSCFVLAWSYVYHVSFPAVSYGPLMGEFRPAFISPGEPIQLCRDITFHRRVTLTITRSLTSRIDGRDVTIELGPMVVVREPGMLSQCRIISVPADLPPGLWTMHTWVTYDTWPFWKQTEEAPQVMLRVLRNGEP